MPNSLESSSQRAATKPAVLRPTCATDGPLLWRIAKNSASLDLNSPYAYTLLADRFHATSLVAELDGESVGFVLGFRIPDREEVLFIWQVAVSHEVRGRGLAGKMLDELVANTSASAIEATVTPTNRASRALFRALAKRHGCSCTESPYYSAEHFPSSDHESETLFHIGPIHPQ